MMAGFYIRFYVNGNSVNIIDNSFEVKNVAENMNIQAIFKEKVSETKGLNLTTIAIIAGSSVISILLIVFIAKASSKKSKKKKPLNEVEEVNSGNNVNTQNNNYLNKGEIGKNENEIEPKQTNSEIPNKQNVQTSTTNNQSNLKNAAILTQAHTFVKGKEKHFISFCEKYNIDYKNNYNIAIVRYYQAYLRSINKQK